MTSTGSGESLRRNIDDMLTDSGGAVDDQPFTSCLNPQDKLTMSLRSFVFLHDQHERRLQGATKSFTEAAMDVSSSLDLLMFLGGAVGGVCGGISGVVWGSLGAVAAATFDRLCGEINAVEATVGFFGSVLGGAAGGVFSGAVGGAVGVAVKAAGYGVEVNEVVWCTVGLITGSAIGSVVGGTVGAAGGGVGGSIGALCGTRGAVYLCGGSAVAERDSKVKKVQNAADELTESLDPLAQQLRIINTTCAESTSGDHEKRVAAQASRILVAITTVQTLMSDCRRAGRPREFGAEAATQSSDITEELRRMRSEAEKLLGSLKKKN